MKVIYTLLCFLFLLQATVNAQYYYDRSKSPAPSKSREVTEKSGADYDQFYFLSWDGNTPTSNTSYISSSSSSAIKLGFRKRLNDVDRLWGGADLGWSVYKQYVPLQTYQYGTTSISTDLYNYSYNYSLTGNLDYFFLPMEKIVTPYAGLGIGLAYAKFSQFYNIYGGSVSSFGLQLRPEAGVLIGFKKNSSWRLKAAFHYDYASTSAKLTSDNGFISQGDTNYKNFVNYGFQIGIVKMAW